MYKGLYCYSKFWFIQQQVNIFKFLPFLKKAVDQSIFIL